MNTKYFDLINQTFYFPQEEFTLNKDHLMFHNIDLMKLVEQYGTPLKFTYLPQISNSINKAKGWFTKSMEKRSEEHTSELQSRENLVCRLLLEKKKTTRIFNYMHT